MLSLDLPPWFFSTTNKLLRGFFWSAAVQAKRGSCVVAWDTICKPKGLGGIGIKNLQLFNHALRMRWRWLSMSGADKPWQGLDFELHEDAEKMFRSCTKLVVGNGERFKF
jgi:hypothetical protein